MQEKEDFIMRASPGLVALLLALPCCSSSLADPIRFTAETMRIPGVSLFTVDLPDPTTGGTIGLGGGSLRGSPGYVMWQSYRREFDEDFSFRIRLDPDLAQQATGSATFLVSGHVQGSIVQPEGSSHASGGFTGSASSVLLDWNSLQGVTIPQSILDLLAHPDRIRLSSYVTGGSMNELQVNLTIDPMAANVPEPATHLGFLALMVGWIGMRRANLHRSRRD